MEQRLELLKSLTGFLGCVAHMRKPVIPCGNNKIADQTAYYYVQSDQHLCSALYCCIIHVTAPAAAIFFRLLVRL